MENKYEKTAKVFKAFCDPNRLRIIEMLQNGEMCACHLLEELNISQSTLSHHMKSLCQSGVVSCQREGKWKYYALNKKGSQSAFDVLTKIMEAPVRSNINDRCECE